MNRFLKTLCLIAFAMAATAMPLCAANYGTVWTGSVDQDFAKDGNWSAGIIAPGAIPLINTTGSTSPILSTGTLSAVQMWIGSTITPATPGPGYMLQTGGSITLSDGVVVGATGVADQSTLRIEGGTFTTPHIVWIGGDGSGGGNGKLEMTGGTLTKGTSQLFEVGYAGGTGEVVMSGTSTINCASEFHVGNAGTGTLTIGTTTGTSTLSVDGILRVGNHVGTGNLNINSGANVNIGSWLFVGGTDDTNFNGSTGTATMTGGTVTKAAGAGDTFMLVGFGGTGTWNQSGGLADIRTGVALGQWGYSGTLSISNGAVFSTGFIQGGYYPDGSAGMRIYLDGGTLKKNLDSYYNGDGVLVSPYQSTNAMFYLKSGGGTIDTSGRNISIDMPILEDPESIGGGLTMIGGGSLKLTGNNTYTGPTVVQAGKLSLPDVSLASSSITVKSGGTLAGYTDPGLLNVYPATTVQSGGTIAPSNTGVQIYLNSLTLANNSNLNVEFNSLGLCGKVYVENNVSKVGTDPITVNVSYTGALTADRTILELSPYSGGTLDSQITFAFVGGAPVIDSDDGIHAPASILTDYALGTVQLKVGGLLSELGPYWKTAGAGNWSGATNWGPSGNVPNNGSERGLFIAKLGGVPINVTLDSNVTVSSLVFGNADASGESYTIAPAAAQKITLKPDVSFAQNWNINVVSGTHTVAADLAITKGTDQSIVRIADKSKLSLNGVVSNYDTNAAGITFDGNGNGMSQTPTTFGTLSLNGLNTFTGPVAMTGYGRLEIGNLGLTTAANSLGQSSPEAANFKINGILAYTGTASTPTTVNTDRGFTLMGAATDPANLGIMNFIEVQDANVNLKFEGQIATSGYSALRKTGPGTLTFANTGTNSLANCDLQIGQGSLVLDGGTFKKDRVNIGFQNGSGDIFVGDTVGAPAALVLQNGATLNIQSGSEINVGWGAGTTGSVTLNDTAKIVGASHLRFGWNGIGSLALNGSSKITNSDHQIVIGVGDGASGTVTINGDGTSATSFPSIANTGAYANCFTWVGPGTTGTLSVKNGTYTESGTMYVGVSTGGLGTLTLNTTPGSLAPAIVNAATLSVGGQYNGSGGGGTGTLSMNSGSQLSVSENLYFGQFGNGTGTIGGATGPNALVSVGGHLYVGFTGTSQGNLTVEPTGNVGVNQWFVVGYSGAADDLGATGVVNNYGTIVKNANNYSFTVIGRAGNGTFNQNAGSFTDGTMTCLGQWGNIGTINLNGGVYSTSTIQAGYWNDSTAYGKVVFDGGTLKVNADSFYSPGVGGTANLITPYEGTMDVIVKKKGAVIDTSGINANILVPLVEDSVSTGGGLTKIGEGALTLVDGNTYKGNTTVNAGTLNVPNLNTPNATVYVATGAAFNATSIVADTLTIGGAPLPVAGSATAAVPEPGTLALLVLAGLGLLLAAWRRK